MIFNIIFSKKKQFSEDFLSFFFKSLKEKTTNIKFSKNQIIIS